MEQRIRKWAATLLRRFGLLGAVVSLLVAFLITVIALIAVSFFVPFSSNNRNIAVGDAFAAGIFMLAAVAAVVAVLAYYQASQRPILNTTWSFRDLRDGSLVPEGNFPRAAPSVQPVDHDDLPDWLDPNDLVPLKPSKLGLHVENSGEVSAKNVAVMLNLSGIYFSPAPRVDTGSPWRLYQEDWGCKIQWEGGSDRSVYLGRPRIPSIALTGMWVLPELGDEPGEIVTLSDLTEPEQHDLTISAAPAPAPATSVEETAAPAPR